MKSANLTGVFTTLMTHDDISEAISKINVPTLVIHGAADVSIELHRGEAMRAALPGAWPMVVVEGAGHAANLTHPEPVNEVIISFMETQDPYPAAPGVWTPLATPWWLCREEHEDGNRLKDDVGNLALRVEAAPRSSMTQPDSW